MSEPTDTPRRLHARIEGRVQGVWYRASTVEEARRLTLTGWVRNRRDGAVELVAEGPESALRQLLDWCRRGPPLARVTAVRDRWEQPHGEFRSFETAPTE